MLCNQLKAMSITFVDTPVSVLLNFPATAKARAYNGYYTIAFSPTKFIIPKTVSAQIFVSGLSPSTVYNFFVNVINSSNVATLTYTASTTTPALTLTAFSKAAFPELIPNIKSLVTSGSVTKDAIISSAFSTGDVVAAATLKTATNKNKLAINAKVLQKSSSAAINKQTNYLIPFDSSVATAQSTSLTSSTGSTIAVVYNTDGTVTIGGTVRSVGQKFLLDGQYLTVASA